MPAPPLGATATTAASGGNREELLGQRPAGCKRQRSRRWEPQPGLGASAPERARMLAKTKNTAIIAALTKVDIIAAQILSENGPALSVIASQCHLSQRERLLLKGRSLLGDAPPIHRERDDGRQHLGGPESVPDAGGAELAAEQPRQRHDEEDIAAEGDDQ